MTFKHYALAWAYNGTPSEKLVLMVLADHAAEDGSCFPGLNRMALMTGLDRSTIVRVLERLEAAGAIVRQRSRGRHPSRYLLTVAPRDRLHHATDCTVPEELSHGAPPTVAQRASNCGVMRPEPTKEPINEPRTNPGVRRSRFDPTPDREPEAVDYDLSARKARACVDELAERMKGGGS